MATATVPVVFFIPLPSRNFFSDGVEHISTALQLVLIKHKTCNSWWSKYIWTAWRLLIECYWCLHTERHHHIQNYPMAKLHMYRKRIKQSARIICKTHPRQTFCPKPIFFVVIFLYIGIQYSFPKNLFSFYRALLAWFLDTLSHHRCISYTRAYIRFLYVFPCRCLCKCLNLIAFEY